LPGGSRAEACLTLPSAPKTEPFPRIKDRRQDETARDAETVPPQLRAAWLGSNGAASARTQ